MLFLKGGGLSTDDGLVTISRSVFSSNKQGNVSTIACCFYHYSYALSSFSRSQLGNLFSHSFSYIMYKYLNNIFKHTKKPKVLSNIFIRDAFEFGTNVTCTKTIFCDGLSGLSVYDGLSTVNTNCKTDGIIGTPGVGKCPL